MHQESKRIKKVITIMALAMGAVILSLAPETYAAKSKSKIGIIPLTIENSDFSNSKTEKSYKNLDKNQTNLT